MIHRTCSENNKLKKKQSENISMKHYRNMILLLENNYTNKNKFRFTSNWSNQKLLKNRVVHFKTKITTKWCVTGNGSYLKCIILRFQYTPLFEHKS